MSQSWHQLASQFHRVAKLFVPPNHFHSAAAMVSTCACVCESSAPASLVHTAAIKSAERAQATERAPLFLVQQMNEWKQQRMSVCASKYCALCCEHWVCARLFTALGFSGVETVRCKPTAPLSKAKNAQSSSVGFGRMSSALCFSHRNTYEPCHLL